MIVRVGGYTLNLPPIKVPPGLKVYSDLELQFFQKKDKELIHLISGYMYFRNLATVQQQTQNDGSRKLCSVLSRIDHLSHSDQMIVAAQNIIDLRLDVRDLKQYRKEHRRNSLVRLRRLRDAYWWLFAAYAVLVYAFLWFVF